MLYTITTEKMLVGVGARARNRHFFLLSNAELPSVFERHNDGTRVQGKNTKRFAVAETVPYAPHVGASKGACEKHWPLGMDAERK